jgi:pimeloyl-ACP methyl ester carboxylesterase
MNDDEHFFAQDVAARTTPWDEAEFGCAFHHETGHLTSGMRIHLVMGGHGPAIVLLHGFPQHWREWRRVMPALARAGRTVIAPDLRGFGLSDKPLDGFDVGTVGEDVREAVRHFNYETIALVGHDVGASVAYAWAAAHPTEVSALVLIEAFPAGLEPQSSGPPMLRGKPTWHLAFLSTPDLPEALLAGREQLLLEYLFRTGAYDPTTFSDEDVDAYARPFAMPGGVRAAAAHVRAMPKSAELNRRLAGRKLPMPVLAIGGEISFGSSMAQAAYRYAENVTGVTAERSGHWIPEERPVWLSQQLLRFFTQAGSRSGDPRALIGSP